MKKEFTDDRIIQIDDRLNAKWVENNEFNQKVLYQKLDPVK
jgi:hypothetical protein